jgi:hypothetical protein
MSSSLFPSKASWSQRNQEVAVLASSSPLPLYAVAMSSASMAFTKIPSQSIFERKFDLQNKKRQRLDNEESINEIKNDEEEALMNSVDKYLSSKSKDKFYRKIVVHIMVSGDDSPQGKALNDAISKFRYKDSVTLRRFQLSKKLQDFFQRILIIFPMLL